MPDEERPPLTIDQRLEKLRRQCEELAASCHELLGKIPTGTDAPKTQHPETGLPELLKSIAAAAELRAKNRRHNSGN